MCGRTKSLRISQKGRIIRRRREKNKSHNTSADFSLQDAHTHTHTRSIITLLIFARHKKFTLNEIQSGPRRPQRCFACVRVPTKVTNGGDGRVIYLTAASRVSGEAYQRANSNLAGNAGLSHLGLHLSVTRLRSLGPSHSEAVVVLRSWFSCSPLTSCYWRHGGSLSTNKDTNMLIKRTASTFRHIWDISKFSSNL